MLLDQSFKIVETLDDCAFQTVRRRIQSALSVLGDGLTASGARAYANVVDFSEDVTFTVLIH